jgi:Methyltransferase domain
VLPAELGHRLGTFSAVFDCLRALGRPITIVETGCLRAAGNYAGDGQSTLLFADLVDEIGGDVFSVDISPQSVAAAISVVGRRVDLYCMDSVKYLARFPRGIDLLYLDSYDFDGNEPMKSAIHHLYELAAAAKNLHSGTIVLVDDTSRRTGVFFGKGMLIAEYMAKIDAKILCEGETQIAWLIP